MLERLEPRADAKTAQTGPDTTGDRLLARLVREVLHGHEYESLADLVADLKTLAASRRIPAPPDAVSGALRLVGSNHPLVTRGVH